MKRKIFSILFALVLVLGLSLIPVQTSTVEANGPAAGDVEVTVYEQDGTTAISGAEVGLFWGAPAWKWMDKKTTDASGQATFTAAEIATWRTANGDPTLFQVYAGATATYGNVLTWAKDTEMPCITYNNTVSYAFSYNLVMLLQQKPEMSYDNDTKVLTVTYTLAEELSPDWLEDTTAKMGLFMGPYASDPHASGVFQAFPDGAGGWNKYWLMPTGYQTATVADIDDVSTISADFDLDDILGAACNMECEDTVIAVPFLVKDNACNECTNCGDFYGLVSSSSFQNLIVMEDAGAALLEPTTINPVTVAPGDNVLVKWFFHADCETSQDFYIEIYDPVLGRISPQITSTVPDTKMCDCFIGEALIPIDSLAEEGTYNVKIRSLCPACSAEDEEVDAVIVDATPPEVELISPTTATNLKDCMDLEISGTMYDEGGISNVLLEFSTDSGTTWPITLYDGDPSGVGYDPDKHTFTTETDFHVGDGGLVGINSCLCHVRVTVTDGVGLTASAASEAFIIDNQAPVVTVVRPNGGEKWEGCTEEDIEWTVVENCGSLNIKIEFSDDCTDTPDWKTVDEGALTSPYSWHVDPTVNSDDCCIRITATDCPGNSGSDDSDEPFEITSPPMLFDAITGWTWAWGPTDNPVNSNTPYSIMVVFNKELDLDTVQITDFAVINPAQTITDMEVHTYHSCKEWKGWTTVFLTVSPIMKTDETPTVQIMGEIRDTDDIALLDKLPEGAPDESPPYQEVVCQDGIAPLVEVTAAPEEPGYNEMATITVQASELLSEAYLFVGEGYPQDYPWCKIKPIGWPPTWPNEHEPPEAWEAKDWLVMEEGVGNKWTVSFRNEWFSPNDNWFVEVAAHDFTEWEVFPWKHEKWTEESFIFVGADVFVIDLYEGWNLISVPRDLVAPTPQGFFSGIGQYKGVTKVYYYDTTLFSWLSAALNPLTGTWSGNLTIIEPGKGYWVWCSPPQARLLVKMKPIDPLVVPPSYNLVAGWNMIGVAMLNPIYFSWHGEEHMYMHDYLSSLGGGEHGNAIWSVLYWYFIADDSGSWGWLRTTPNSLYEMCWWFAGWHEWACPTAIPGHGYWIFMNQSGVLAP